MKEKKTKYLDINDAFDKNIQFFDMLSLCIQSSLNEEETCMQCPPYNELEEAVNAFNDVLRYDKLVGMISRSPPPHISTLFTPYRKIQDPMDNKKVISPGTSFMTGGSASLLSISEMQKEMVTYNKYVEKFYDLKHEYSDIRDALEEYELTNVNDAEKIRNLNDRLDDIVEEMIKISSSVKDFDKIRRNGECIKPLFEMSASLFDFYSDQLRKTKSDLMGSEIQLPVTIETYDDEIEDALKKLSPMLSEQNISKINECMDKGIYDDILKEHKVLGRARFISFIDDVYRFSRALRDMSIKIAVDYFVPIDFYSI